MLDSFSDSSLQERESDYLSDPQGTQYVFQSPTFAQSSLQNTQYDQSEKDQLLQVPDSVYNKHMALRASTAPPRPLTDIQEFRRSSDFLLIQHTVICSSQLIQRADNKYDLDSEAGQRACKKFLNQVQRLCQVFKVESSSRDYRSEFTKAYRVLYKEGSLCYLTQILDSAQERIPHLWVNGEKYEFTNQVLELGSSLYNGFNRVQYMLREIYNRVIEQTCPGNLSFIIQELKTALQEFDSYWADFQHAYVMELMMIEADARALIINSISVQKQLVAFQNTAKIKGKSFMQSQVFSELRCQLVKLIGKINSVANIQGKGRDDLSVEILTAAEGIFRRISAVQSSALRTLSYNIRKSFADLRLLLRRYDHNIQVVDPQLKNNPQLVDALANFQSTWQKGKIYLLNHKRCHQLIHWSQQLDILTQKYPLFKQQVEQRDAELFISIPGFLILLKLEQNDKDLCRHFCKPFADDSHPIGLLFKRLKRAYNFGKLTTCQSSEYYEFMQRAVLGFDVQNREDYFIKQFDNFDYTLQKIRNLAIELQRYKPVQWNRFLDVALGQMANQRDSNLMFILLFSRSSRFRFHYRVERSHSQNSSQGVT